MEELYRSLGRAKSRELSQKCDTLWSIYGRAKSGTRSKQVGGIVYAGIAKDFIQEFLPTGFGLKSGLVFDIEKGRLSPQIDVIIHKGAPLIEFADAIITEKKQVKAIFEIKSWIDTPGIFGNKRKDGSRDSSSGLVKTYEDRKYYIGESVAKYILFAFSLDSAEQDDKVINRLNQICDMYAIVRRRKARVRIGKGNIFDYNFDNSVSGLIKWLRNLS